MKLFIDFFPIILFFIAFKFADIYVATGVTIIATLLQIGYLRIKTGKTEPMHWVSLVIVGLLGGATILFHNENFIKWKPTALYWVMALVLIVGQVFFKKSFIKSLMGKQLDVALPDSVWRNLTWSWAIFFTGMGILNLWVAFNFSLDTWVDFKLFGGMGLMFIFVIIQAVYMSRHIAQTSPESKPEVNSANDAAK